MNQDKKFAVVTGGSLGIGFELAKVFAQNDFDLLIAARGESNLEQAATELRGLGAQVTVVPADLSKYDGVEDLANAISQAGRPVDAIALNAGHGVGGRFWDQTDLAEELHLVQLNISSLIHLAKRVLPDMVARGSGKLLFTGSVAGTAPLAYEAVYSASKAFVNSFALSLGAELKDTGVTVTVLMPNATDTEFFHRAHMDDTPVGQEEKDDPAQVAKQGFDAMMAGEASVFGGGLKRKIQGVVNKVLPGEMTAQMYKDHSKPDSLKH